MKALALLIALAAPALGAECIPAVRFYVTTAQDGTILKIDTETGTTWKLSHNKWVVITDAK